MTHSRTVLKTVRHGSSDLGEHKRTVLNVSLPIPGFWTSCDWVVNYLILEVVKAGDRLLKLEGCEMRV